MDDGDLVAVLLESQRLGFLGRREISEVIEHARHFVSGLEGVTGRVADIGAGGGVPGLVVAHDRPDLKITLIDRRATRMDFVRRSVRRLGWDDRVSVVTSDVDELEDAFDAVIARGFGPPTSTLRSARRLLTPAGIIVVSEPPDGDRWDAAVVTELGLTRRAAEPTSSIAVFGS
mgnify:CR=1 FL=1